MASGGLVSLAVPASSPSAAIMASLTCFQLTIAVNGTGSAGSTHANSTYCLNGAYWTGTVISLQSVVPADGAFINWTGVWSGAS